MRAAVIINPSSGLRRRRRPAASLAALAERTLQAAGVSADVAVTARTGDAYRLARAAVAEGAALVFAWGGDGTVNEVAAALAFTPVALAIVPAGSGNGLARALGIPRRPEDALRAGLERPERLIDIGQLGGRYFVNVAGVGLDADVALAYGRGTRRGLLPYVWHAARALTARTPNRYAIEAEDVRLDQEALIVALANGPQYGSGARIAPMARFDDGALDLVVVGALPRWQRMVEARRLFTGTLAASSAVFFRTVTRVRIEAREPQTFHVDGEPASGSAVLEAQVHPRALRLRA